MPSRLLQEKAGWEGLKCIGAVHTEFESKGVKGKRMACLYFQSGIDSRETCCAMSGWNGQWKQCTGC